MLMAWVSPGILSRSNEVEVSSTIIEKPLLYDLNDSTFAGKKLNDLLEKYKGKVVYIDFWASWCKPCLAEMHESLRLQDYFKNERVVFLYISFDRNKSAWENRIMADSLSGEHYLGSREFLKSLKEEYNLVSVPRYFLVNRKGKIIDMDAPAPSEERVVNQINQLL